VLKLNYTKLILNYINDYPEDEPIFIDDIKRFVIEFCADENREKILENVNVIINRLNKENIIKTFYKGIYYKPKTNIFGEMPLDKSKVINLKYLKDRNGNVKGYIKGEKLFNALGLTTQVPNITHIVTNEWKNANIYKNEYLNVLVSRPKIEITNENYKYLQFIDLLNDIDNIYIEVDNYEDIIYNFILQNELEFEKILKYIRETKNVKIMSKLLILAR